MNKIRHYLLLLVILLYALFAFGCDSLAKQEPSDVTSQSSKQSSSAKSNAPKKTYQFRTKELYQNHYNKHHQQFGSITKEEYLKNANKLIAAYKQSTDVLSKQGKDDDTLFYHVKTNEFLVLSPDGYIRTYFKPTKGIEYYNRQ